MIPLVSKEELNCIENRICYRCGKPETFVSKNTGVAAWRRRKINGKWDGKNHFCDLCGKKLERKWRNKQLDKESKTAKGFRVEQSIAKGLNIKNCNVELDDFNAVFDLYDPVKYKDISCRSRQLGIKTAYWDMTRYEYIVWHFPIQKLRDFDYYFAACMTKDYKDIARIYTIPVDKLTSADGFDIYPDKPGDYEIYRDDELLNIIREAYHNLSIEDCPAIKNDKKIKNNETK